MYLPKKNTILQESVNFFSVKGRMVSTVGFAGLWSWLQLLGHCSAQAAIDGVKGACSCANRNLSVDPEFGVRIISLCHKTFFFFKIFPSYLKCKLFLVHELYKNRHGPDLACGLQIADLDMMNGLYIQQPRAWLNWFFICIEPNNQFILYLFIYFIFSGLSFDLFYTSSV